MGFLPGVGVPSRGIVPCLDRGRPLLANMVVTSSQGRSWISEEAQDLLGRPPCTKRASSLPRATDRWLPRRRAQAKESELSALAQAGESRHAVLAPLALAQPGRCEIRPPGIGERRLYSI